MGTVTRAAAKKNVVLAEMDNRHATKLIHERDDGLTADADSSSEEDDYELDVETPPITESIQRSPQNLRKQLSKAQNPHAHSENYHHSISHNARWDGTRSRADQNAAQARFKSKPEASWSIHLSDYALPVSIAVVVFVAAVAYFLTNSTAVEPTASDLNLANVLEKFEEKIRPFSSRFQNQKSTSWRKLRTTVKATTAFAKPQTPGVIALVSLNEAETLTNCVGRIIAASLRDAYNDSRFVSLKGKDFAGKRAGDVKMEIDEKIHRGLSQGQHVVLLEGMHHLPAESGLLFHGLCDNENAPFTQVVYIFTSSTDKIEEDETQQEATTFWKGRLTDDQRYSLETRIGNNIIVINPESEESHPKECLN